jgi:hypothetical protein
LCGQIKEKMEEKTKSLRSRKETGKKSAIKIVGARESKRERESRRLREGEREIHEVSVKDIKDGATTISITTINVKGFL